MKCFIHLISALPLLSVSEHLLDGRIISVCNKLNWSTMQEENEEENERWVVKKNKKKK